MTPSCRHSGAESFQRTIDGRPWLVHEMRYAIFPEQSGTLDHSAHRPTQRGRATPRRSLFDLGGGGRQLRRSTELLSIDVLPRPASLSSKPTGCRPGELTLEECWSTPPEQLRVGESATRTITIRGLGLQGAQLPPVLFPATRGLKFYPDQPVISDSESATGLVGHAGGQCRRGADPRRLLADTGIAHSLVGHPQQ